MGGDTSTAFEGEPGWVVLKFGGTSVASLARWRSIESIVGVRRDKGSSVLLVCSALAGITDLLTALVAAHGDDRAGEEYLRQIREAHQSLARELAIELPVAVADLLANLTLLLAADEIDPRTEAEIMGSGELMSTHLGAAWLQSRGVECAWLDARELLVSDSQIPRRDEHYLSASCRSNPDPAARERVDAAGAPVVVTQGFIASSPDGETVLLGRGGSDASAAYLAAVISARRLEIWTDVPGLFTAHPRVVPEARLLLRIDYREAQALGALGAGVLHPRAVEVAWEHGIPIELGWTEHPDVQGTCINASRATPGVKAVTSRERLAMFSLRRPPSWQPVGFLADVAGCFKRRGLSMDLVSSSCSEIRVTVDIDAFPSVETEIPDILRELETTCIPRVVEPVASVSVVGGRVGQSLLESEGAFELFAGDTTFMVVHAANEHHVSVVLAPHAAERLVRAVHGRLIDEPERHDLGPTWAELASAGATGRGAA